MGNGAHGQWGNSIKGVWGTGGICHMGNGVQVVWAMDTGGMGHRGVGHMGQ